MVGNRTLSQYDFLGLTAPDFTPICDIAKELQSKIDRLPKNSLKRLFLDTQKCILDKLCDSKCCIVAGRDDWLNSVVRDFMTPMIAALSGDTSSEWGQTFTAIDAMQSLMEQSAKDLAEASKNGKGVNFPTAQAMIDFMKWRYELEVARLMALVHIQTDLRQSLKNNGVGDDGDWACLGKQIKACGEANLGTLTTALGDFLSIFDPAFSIDAQRDKMRNDLKPPPPPENPLMPLPPTMFYSDYL